MVGLELCRSGFRAGFIDHPVEREIVTRNDGGEVVSTRTVVERVAVRENFPLRFYEAVKQKARWIVGTAFQGWQHAGWWGSPAVRYTLFRDRRAPVVHCINAAGYCVMGYVLLEFAVLHSNFTNWLYVRPLFEADSLLWRIVLVDTALLAYRVGQKVTCVSNVYGLRQGLFAIPRYPVVNFINMGATMRAAWLYVAHRLFNVPLAWTKTTHVFPGEAELLEYSRSVEDLLVEEGYVTRHELQEILSKHKGLSAPGHFSICNSSMRTNLLDIWSRFARLCPETLTPEDISEDSLETWSEAQAVRFEGLPIGACEDGGLAFAFTEPPSEENLQAVAEIAGAPVEARLLRPSNFTALRNTLYPARALDGQPNHPLQNEFEALA
jgi:adsorption protein B